MICTALVIDDEPLARKRMEALLEGYSSELEILGFADSGTQAIKLIKELNPDVVFLDIQMPDMDAFEVLHSLTPDEIPFVVFTTAYDNFALKAFEENTIDYLLKPVEPERLAVAIEKLRKIMPKEESEVPVPTDFTWEKFRNFVDMSNFYLQRLQIRLADRIVFVNMEEVIRFHSEEKNTRVYTISGEYTLSSTLIELERKLNPQHFVRIHRASIVAIDYIAEIRRSPEGRETIVLRDKENTELLVSRALERRLHDL